MKIKYIDRPEDVDRKTSTGRRRPEDVDREDVDREDVDREDVDREDVDREDVDREDVDREDVDREDVHRRSPSKKSIEEVHRISPSKKSIEEVHRRCPIDYEIMFDFVTPGVRILMGVMGFHNICNYTEVASDSNRFLPCV